MTGRISIIDGGAYMDAGNGYLVPVVSAAEAAQNGGPVATFSDANRTSLNGLGGVPVPVSGAGKSPYLLPRWKTALGKVRAGTANAKLLVMSDSTGAGAIASSAAYGANDMSRSWPFKLAPLLAAAGYPATTGAIFGEQTGTDVIATLNAHDTRRLMVAPWAFSVVALGGKGLSNNTAGSQTPLRFIPVEPFDTIKVTYLRNTSYGKFSISVDGGAAEGAVVDTAGAIAVLTTTRTVALGTHYVDIARSAPTGADGALLIFKVEVWNSATKCVQIFNASVGSSTTLKQSANTNVYDPLAMAVSDPADLVIICLDINNWHGNYASGIYDLVTATTHSFQLQKMIDALRPVSDIILMTGAPSAVGTVPRAYQDSILKATRHLASVNNLPLVDISGDWGDYIQATASGYYLPIGDSVHPGDPGYIDIAARVAALPGFFGV